ncbi:MAG: SH3 domain-containing protein [Steroidobacteraceae bacterium]|nr:SH3 domain-containing protein [Steroidobacteraceae bacterium]
MVKDAYIDLHTGPGRGFPVTFSVERGVTIELLRQRTDWIEVRTARGQRGWVHRSQLENTLTPAGSEVHIAGPGQDARTEHQWEAGVAVGDFGGANVVSVNGAYALTHTLLVRADVSQLLGDTSNGWLGTAGIAQVFMPQWPVSPVLGIGVGVLSITPKAPNTKDSTDATAYGSLGFRSYLTDRFLMQADYRRFVVFTSGGGHEEKDEWIAGFSYFF